MDILHDALYPIWSVILQILAKTSSLLPALLCAGRLLPSIRPNEGSLPSVLFQYMIFEVIYVGKKRL